MRNLKRALSLTLASVMLLGMMVVGSSAAAGYSDVDAEDNVEAIEVLQAIEVMVGDERGFGPDRPVTRNEMAVVMGKLLNLNYNYYASTCPFTDVATWARGWVGAAAANGIVSGRGNGIYDGEATVTAIEAASMMMRALGYFKYTEDYADGFQLSTVRQGSDIGIFNGVGTDGNTPMTRNQVAQMALNALRSNMVTFTGTPGISVNGVTVGYRAEYTPRTGTESKYNAIAGLTTTILSDNGQYFVQLGEQLYDGDLRLIDTAADDFDRPARHWEYDGKAIGTYAKEELLRQEYTVAVTGKDLYNLLSSATISEYDVSYFVDGKVDDTIKASNMIRTNDRDYATTGKGVLTQVFVDNAKKEITIVSINTYLAKATADYNSRKGTLSVDVYNAASATPKTIEAEEVPGIEDYKSGDYILVNWAEIGSTGNKMEVVAVSNPETQSDVKVNKYSFESYLVTGGTQYDYGKDGIYKNELGEYTNDLLKNHSYILYFDQYGYLAGVREFEGQKNYLFLAAYDGTGSNMGIKTFPGAAVFLDGTMAEIQIDVTETNKNLTKDGTTSAGAGNANMIDNTNYPLLNVGDPQYNRWFTYTTTTRNGTTVYTLKPTWIYNSSTDTVTNRWAEQTAKGSDPTGTPPTGGSDTEVKINSGSVRVVADIASGTPVNKRAYGNDDSVYLTMEINDVSEDSTTNKAQIGLTKVTGVYTGVQDVDLRVYGAKTNTLKTNSGIIAVFDEDLYIIGAVVVGEDDSSSDSYIYILDSAKNERYDDENDCTFWEMDAVVDGVISTVTVKDKYGNLKTQVNNITGTANPGKDCLVKVTYDKDGYITDIPVIQPTDVNTDDRYSAKDYTTDIEDGYNGGANDFKTYSVKYEASPDDNNDPTTGEFYRIGRTLYNRTETKAGGGLDAGITLGTDGKVIVVQNDITVKGQKAKRVWDEFSDLQSAINWLADSKTFKGHVSAVLNDNGSAKYIVFNGISPLDTVDELDTDGSIFVQEYNAGKIDITATKRINAVQIEAAVRSFLKDSAIDDIVYDGSATSGKATVSYTDGRRDVIYNVEVNLVRTQAQVDGARTLNAVQEAIDAVMLPYGKITIVGNTMTTYSADGQEYLSDDQIPGKTVSMATADFSGFLNALKDADAKKITYNKKDYEWDEDAKTNKWVNGSDSLVSAVVAQLVKDLDVAKWSGDGKTHSAKITLDVDGEIMNFVIEVVDTGTPTYS